jgi:hypothetical protein
MRAPLIRLILKKPDPVSDTLLVMALLVCSLFFYLFVS